MQISQRAANVKPSATLAVDGKAKQMKAQGIDVLSFSAGEPDFNTPERIQNAAIMAMQQGQTKYTPTPGILPLRQAIVDKFHKEYGYEITPEMVIVSCGAKHSIYLALAALIDPGDEVLIPAPYWVSYPPQVELNGGVSVIVETKAENGFRMTPEELRQAITPRSRVLILNSPSNPTGQVYSKQELAALAEVLRDTGITVISDDIYQKLLYDGQTFAAFSQVSDDARARTVVINGVSKCSAMTGWRIGYLVAEPAFAKAVARLQGQMTSHPTSIAQFAAVEAIAGEGVELKDWLARYQKRRDIMVAGLNAMDGVQCDTPQGAFYAFADFRGVLGKQADGRVIQDDMELADYLLESVQVACVPGSAFGAPGFLRLSFATSSDVIEKGIARLQTALSRLG